jgi:ATP-dependent phosphoenolpyruvate carboxykinase
MGALLVNTGRHTARAAADKFVVKGAGLRGACLVGQYNRPFNPDNFSALLTRLQGYLQGRDIFVRSVPLESEEPYKEEKIEANLFDLLEAFRQVLARVKPETFHEIQREAITVEQKIQEKSVLITLDDGVITDYTVAIPF